MKKSYRLIPFILIIFVLSSCSAIFPASFFKKHLSKIPTECDDYSIILSRDVKEDIKILDFEYLELNTFSKETTFFDFENIKIEQKSNSFTLYFKDKTYDINEQYFIDNSETYNNILKIWLKWNKKIKLEELKNNIDGIAIADDLVFIITRSTKAQLNFLRQYPIILWKFDITTGEIFYCNYLTDEDNSLFREAEFEIIIK